MPQRRVSDWLRHGDVPGIGGFAALAGIEAVSRGILISVLPVAIYRALGDAGTVAATYFAVGVLSTLAGLLVPFAARIFARRNVYVFGALLFVLGAGLGSTGGAVALVCGLLLTTVAVATTFVCFNAYVLDHVEKLELGRMESWRLTLAGFGWTAGPALGVLLYGWWPPAPFLIAGTAETCLIAMFLYLRFGNGKAIQRAKRPAPNPLAYLPRFFAQPRLVTGWSLAVMRSVGWWVFVVYLPIFALQAGLGERLGGVALSVSNGMLFLAPLMLRVIRRISIRSAIRAGFLCAGLAFACASALSSVPAAAVGFLMAGTVFLILLDVCAGLPFLLAVKPSERTEMSAVYSSFRDISGIVAPGAAWLVLAVLPLGAVFMAAGGGLIGAWALAGRLNPKLGSARVPRAQASQTAPPPLA